MGKNKNIYIYLIVILLLVMTIGYALLNSTLNITGKSNISKNTWDVHFDNITVKKGSVDAVKTPVIENDSTVNFEVFLNLPGDFYEFTVDVVNDGTIDAMIDSIEKTPDLTQSQLKYLNYIIEYENGEQILSKQLVNKDSFVRIKVRVEYKSDIISIELPTTTETINLSFTLNYVQSDNNGIYVKDEGVKNPYKIISGDLYTFGSELVIANEHFYVIETVGDYITLLSKYNLYVGNKVIDGELSLVPVENSTGIQSSKAIGRIFSEDNNTFPWYGVTPFSVTNYWWDSSTDFFKTNYNIGVELGEIFVANIYDNSSYLYNYVENYKNYLESKDAIVKEARLVNINDLLKLGCNIYDVNCLSAPEWVYSTSYWTGIGISLYDNHVIGVKNNGNIDHDSYDYDCGFGIRPVIIIEK